MKQVFDVMGFFVIYYIKLQIKSYFFKIVSIFSIFPGAFSMRNYV